jgi:hypothetical protein
MSPKNSIRNIMDYSMALRLGRFGHLCIPKHLGAIRALFRP